jgi:hypothetical protein
VRLADVLRVARGFRGVFDLHAVQEKDAPTKPVMAMGVFFITIETEAQTMSFCHLVRGEASLAALVATLLGGRRGSRKCRWLQGCWKSWPGRGGGQQVMRGRLRGRLHPSVQLL